MGLFRLILAFLVVADHTLGYSSLFALDIGTVAVSTFFFISGFLMPLAFNINYQQTSFRERYKCYSINRMLRIFPIYWLSLIIILVRGFLLYLKHGFAEVMFLHPLNYLQNFILIGLNQSKFWGEYSRFNNPAWTLDVELQYYLVAPLLVLLQSYHRIFFILLTTFFSALSVYILWNPSSIVDIDRSLLAWACTFFLGFWFYYSPSFRMLFSTRSSVSIGIPFLAIFVFSTDVRIKTFSLAMACIVLAAHLLILQSARRFGKVDQLAGELSYPVYIFHFIFIGHIGALLYPRMGDHTNPINFLFLFLANISITTVFSYLVYKFTAGSIEKMRLRFKSATMKRKNSLKHV